DEAGFDACLDRGDLALDAGVDVGELPLDALALLGARSHHLARQLTVLGAERGEARGAEDVGREEAVNLFEQHVLTDVLPLPVPECLGGLVAVADAVGAGVIGDALAGLAMHAQRVVAGPAVDDPAQEVGAALAAAALRPAGLSAAGELGLDAHEGFVWDQRLVTALGLDPVVFRAAYHRALAELRLAEVEAVPDQSAGVDVVLKHAAQGRLGPLAGRVALGVDVSRRRRPAGSVEVVGDLLEALAAQVEVEDLDDDGSTVGVDDEPRLPVADARATRVGMRLVLEPVSVGVRSRALAVAAARVRPRGRRSRAAAAAARACASSLSLW